MPDIRFPVPSYSNIRNYVLNQFTLIYETDKSYSTLIDTLHTPFKGSYAEAFTRFDTLRPVFYVWNQYRFPVFFTEPGQSSYINSGRLSFDFYLNSFLLLSGWQEIIITNRDKHGRFRFSDSLQCKYQFASVPVVSIYFKLLAGLLNDAGIAIKEKKFSPDGSWIEMTHDIDTLNNGWWEDCGYYLKNFKPASVFQIAVILWKKFILGKDSYFDGFRELVDITIKKKIPSVFFILVSQSKQDADYNINNPRVKKQIKRLTQAGIQVELHPGYNTCTNLSRLTQQMEQLGKITGQPVTALRQHFLQIDTALSFPVYEKASIRKDYSLGFAEQYGFRNSIATPFNPYLFNENRGSTVLEIPLFFMDGTLVHYLKGDRNELMQTIINEIKELKQNLNCHFSVIFHNTSFTHLKYAGLKEMYDQIVSEYLT